MAGTSTVRVCVDAMGGDNAPDAIIEGVLDAVAVDRALHVILTGPAEVVDPVAESSDQISAVATTEVIGMDEHPANSVRSKKDSSIVVGCRLVREGEADAFFSAGSTGAAMAAATLGMGRIKGVSRPAIGAVIPTGGSPVVLLDVGANADCKPENLVQFAHMGAAYAETVLGIPRPRVGLLNIGEEPSKGSLLAQESHAAMTGAVTGFSGNVEGRDITKGVVDVIVTDGFTGNVALKLLEGLSSTLMSEVKRVMTASVLAKTAALVVRSGFRDLRAELDPDTYGGAPLLGVKGVCIIGHGSSNSTAAANAVRVAARAVRGGLTASIEESVAGQ